MNGDAAPERLVCTAGGAPKEKAGLEGAGVVELPSAGFVNEKAGVVEGAVVEAPKLNKGFEVELESGFAAGVDGFDEPNENPAEVVLGLPDAGASNLNPPVDGELAAG